MNNRFRGSISVTRQAAASAVAAPTLTYLLRDTFSSGNVVSPRLGELGFLQIINAGSAFGVSGDAFVVNGTPGANDRIAGCNSAGTEINYWRVLGRTMRFTVSNRVTMPTGVMRFGFAPAGTSSNTNIGFDYQTAATADRVRVKQGVTPSRLPVTLGRAELQLIGCALSRV